MNLKFIRPFETKRKIYVACSGGVDSLSLLHFAREKGLDPSILFFDHGDEVGPEEFKFLKQHSIEHDFDFCYGENTEVKTSCKSPKEFYREQRYKFFDDFKKEDAIVLLGHTLDDVVEGFLFYTLRCGEGYLIPYERDHCVRPFLMNTKQDCIDYLKKKKISWFEDPTNEDRKYTRNLIRHDMMPVVDKVNPGFKKVVKRKLTEKLTRDGIL